MQKNINKGRFKNILYKNIAHFSRDSSFIIENFLKEDKVIVNGTPTVLNYSDLPNPSLYTNKTFRVLNFGVKGSLWHSNGVTWILKSKILPIGFVFDQNLAAANNNYRSMFSCLLPTNGALSTFRIGDILILTSHFRKVGATSTFARGYSIGATTNSSNHPSYGTTPVNGAIDTSVVQLEPIGPTSETLNDYAERHYFQRTGVSTIRKLGAGFTTSINGMTTASGGPSINLNTAIPAINSIDTSNIYFNACFATGAVDSGILRFALLELLSLNN